MSKLNRNLLVLGFLAFGLIAFAMLRPETTLGPLPRQERVEVGNVSFDITNPKVLQTTVKFIKPAEYHLNATFILTSVIIKNSIGSTVEEVSLPAGIELSISKEKTFDEKTLNFTIQNTLPSGEYAVGVITPWGSLFVSPNFTVP